GKAKPGPVAGAGDKADKLYKQLLRSSVWINGLTKADPSAGKVEYGSGTGVLLEGPRHLVITNHHVVRDRDQEYVLFPTIPGGKLITQKAFYQPLITTGSIVGKVIARNEPQDLAV